MADSDNETGTRPNREAERSRLASVSDGAADAYRAARERTSAAYEGARGAGRRAAKGLESSPVAAVIGGLAVGAIAAAFLPRTRREEKLFGDVGRKINDSAREAARAARDAGREQLNELNLRDALRGRIDDFTDKAVGAVKSSAKGRGKGAAKGG
jgi:hypothetical protein